MIQAKSVKSKQAKIAATHFDERRRSLRFDLTLPVNVVRTSETAVNFRGWTRNLSTHGAYLVIEGEMGQYSAVEFFVTLDGLRNVWLRCQGHVKRAEKLLPSGRLGVAATIQRYEFIRERKTQLKEAPARPSPSSAVPLVA